MRSAPKFILALACVSFLAVTLSGVHVHADVGGHDEAVPHTHDLHPSPSHDLDGDHIDISIFDVAAGASKAKIFVPYFAVPELVAFLPPERFWSINTPSLVPRRHVRWRPPLRAPPLFS